MREAWGCRWERAPQGITFLSVAPWILPPPPDSSTGDPAHVPCTYTGGAEQRGPQLAAWFFCMKWSVPRTSSCGEPTALLAVQPFCP